MKRTVMPTPYEARVVKGAEGATEEQFASLTEARTWLSQWLDDPDVTFLGIYDNLADREVFSEAIGSPQESSRESFSEEDGIDDSW